MVQCVINHFLKTMQNISWCSLWPLNDGDTVGADFCFSPLYSFCYLIQHYVFFNKCAFVCIIYYNNCILNNFTLRILIFIKVTTKGAGLNPNAKVWQEIPSHQSDVTEWTEDTTWLMTYPPPAVMSEGMDV